MEHITTNIDFDVLRRFDKPGPRYTSYPTAPVFSAEYTDKQFELDLIQNNADNAKPLSLYVHIPFCDSLCYFCGCTTVITSQRDRIAEYLHTLKQEINRVAHYIHRGRVVTQIHWGGGTPSYLTPAEITDLAGFIAERFNIAPDAECSVEIDPRELTYEHLSAFRQSGFNRISLGVQDFTPRVQAAIHRTQPKELTLQTMQWARELGFQSINLDLIYGLPLQTVETFQHTLDEVALLTPERIAVFNFAYVPNIKPHQKLIHAEDLPSPETKLQMLKTTIETLTRAGYAYIGMDHFARPNDDLALAQKRKTLHRNFQGYSTRAETDLLGFGMSAISHFGTVYAQNMKTLQAYRDSVRGGAFPTQVGYRMNLDDVIRKHVIMQLMCNLEIDIEDVERCFALHFDEYYESALEQLDELEMQGLVERTKKTIRVVGTGRFLLRNIAMCFDAYLPKLQAIQPVFSRTV